MPKYKEKRHQCDQCTKAFTCASALKVHMRVHTDERPYACDVCGASFKTKSNLTKHMRTHTGERPYACDVCCKNFLRKEHLIIHMRTHTREKPYLCEHPGCNKCFTQMSALTIHMRTHTGEKPYACNVCSKTFAAKGNLTTHIRTHTGEKPYACDYPGCNLRFTVKHAVTTHKRRHTGEKPFACKHPGCDWKFTTSGALTTHMRTHTGEKPYACDYPGCDMRFARKSDITGHMRTHTGEKPYACEFCDKTFTTSGNLAMHTRTHTGPFCTICNKYCVPVANTMCGYCTVGSTYGKKERTVFDFLAGTDLRLGHFIRDQALGCGNRRRPDGYVSLWMPVEDTAVMFIVEVDENEHRRYNPSCESKRLEEIHERHGGPLFVLRYNPDQPGGLDPKKLSELAARCVEILEGDYVMAMDVGCGVLIEYHGYSDEQIRRVELAHLASQAWGESEEINV